MSFNRHAEFSEAAENIVGDAADEAVTVASARPEVAPLTSEISNNSVQKRTFRHKSILTMRFPNGVGRSH